MIVKELLDVLYKCDGDSILEFALPIQVDEVDFLNCEDITQTKSMFNTSNKSVVTITLSEF